MTAFLYDLIFLLPLSFGAFSFALPRIFAEEAAREEGPSRLLWLIPLLASICCLVFKHAKAAWRGVLAGMIITFFLAAVLLQPAEERAAFAKSLLPHGQALLLVLLCFALSEVLQRIPKFRFIPAALLVLLLPLFLAFRYQPPQTGVCMILLYALLTMADLYQRLSSKQGDTEPAKHLVRVSPFLLIVFLLLSLIKAPEQPYQWTIVKRVASIVHGTVVMVGEQLFMGDRWGGDKPVIGFSDRGSVGGDLGSSGYTVMEITAQGTKDPVLYLGGKSFDSFDGGEWEKSGGFTHDAQGLDTVETIAAAIRDRGADRLNDMVRSVNLGITYKSLRTKSVFVLPKTIPMREEQQENIITDDGDLRFSNRLGARGPYSLIAYRLNRREEGFEGLLKNPPAGAPSREDWEEAMKVCGVAGRAGYAYEDYLAAREELKTQYLPETPVTPAVREWLDALLEGCGSDYEKLKRIEAELKSYRYTEKPGKNETEDAAAFLERFVLEKREGYCSHFATAFVLLARAEGIPARYVQGFRAPVGKEELNEISSSCAHAWPEAYLDGIGWIGFEPTPGYEIAVSGWYTSAEREGAAKKEDERGARGTMTAEERRAAQQEAAGEEEEEEEPRFTLRWYQAVIPLLAGAIPALLIFAADAARRRRQYLAMSERDKSLFQCRRGLKLLKRLHIPRSEDETLEEYARRIEKQVPAERLGFLKTYEELLYSRKQTGEKERLALEEEMERLRLYVREARRHGTEAENGEQGEEDKGEEGTR